MNKADQNDTNREKFFAGCIFKAGKEIARYNEWPGVVNPDRPPGLKDRFIVLVNDKNKPFIKIASMTDHSFSFLHSYFGKVDLITVFFSELIFIPDEIEVTSNELDENFTITNQI